MTQYSACVEFYGGLTEQTQDDLQRILKLDWSDVGGLNVETIIQDVITMETELAELKDLMHSSTTALPQNPSCNIPAVGHVPHNFTPAPAPKQNQVDDELAAVVNKLTLSMAEIANAIKAQYRPQQY